MLQLIATAVAVAVAVAAADRPPGTGAKLSKQPSFLFILADDWGWGDVGVYGANGDVTLSGTNVRTPTLDALAKNGTLMTDFHGNALCSPSRSQVTGHRPCASTMT